MSDWIHLLSHFGCCNALTALGGMGCARWNSKVWKRPTGLMKNVTGGNSPMRRKGKALKRCKDETFRL
jgi:hypothetical protein